MDSSDKQNFYGPTFFAKLIFFPPKLFLVFWKREIFLSKKKFGGKKINLAKTIFPFFILSLSKVYFDPFGMD
jgi:hypothetical protein